MPPASHKQYAFLRPLCTFAVLSLSKMDEDRVCSFSFRLLVSGAGNLSTPGKKAVRVTGLLCPGPTLSCNTLTSLPMPHFLASSVQPRYLPALNSFLMDFPVHTHTHTLSAPSLSVTHARITSATIDSNSKL